MALQGILEAEGRTGAIRGAVGRLSDLVLGMRRQDIEESRYQEGAELRGLQTEAAGLNIQNLRNQIKVQEAEESRLSEPLPIDSFRGAFEDPSLYDAAKNIADSMGFINYDDPNLPTITRRDMSSMYEILSQSKVRTDMAITGYGAFEKRYNDLTKAISDYEAQNEGKGKNLQEDKNYQYLVQQRGLAEQKAMQYKQIRDALLGEKADIPGALEKDVRFLMEDLGMGQAEALELSRRRKEGKDSDENFLRSVYTKVISAGGSDEEASASVDAAKTHFGIGKEKAVPGADIVTVGALKFTVDELKAFGVEEDIPMTFVTPEGELPIPKPAGKKVLPKLRLEKYQRSETVFKSELKKITKKFNDAKKRLKRLRKAKADKSIIEHTKKEVKKLSKELIKLSNVQRKLNKK